MWVTDGVMELLMQKMFLIDMELETLDGPIFRVMPLHAMAHAQQWIDFAGY